MCDNWAKYDFEAEDAAYADEFAEWERKTLIDEEVASWYYNKEGDLVQCRVYSTGRALSEDPRGGCGCESEILASVRRKDINDGCPHCTELVANNSDSPALRQHLLWG